MAGNGVEIRLAAPPDAEIVARILARSFAEFRSRYTAAAFRATVLSPSRVRERLREGPVWVGSLEAASVATVSAVATEKGVYVRGMAVVPEARGRRIGWRLLAAVEELARRRRAGRLYLSSTPFLRPAITLYERFGFAATDEGPHDLFGTPLFTMAKKL